MTSAELQKLIAQYVDGTISEPDFNRLWETLSRPENEEQWKTAIAHFFQNEQLHGQSTSDQALQSLANIKHRIREQEKRSVSVFRIGTYKMLRVAAAAVIIIGASVLVMVNYNKSNAPQQAATESIIHHDAQPGTNKAVLTLADGTTIDLDDSNNGTIAQQGHIKILKLSNGQLAYKPANGNASPISGYNTIATPRGGQYQLQLADGTNVWLNAESSISYPVAFSPDERRVKITGEAYFEVAHDKTKPFRVDAEDEHIEVLGTHFNINAYKDQRAVKTSLLEGSVKIYSGNKNTTGSKILKPGQAYVNGRVMATNTDQDVAWKNGIFNFNDQDLLEVMHQLARWYNVDVVYPNGVPNKQYGGEIGRNLNLSQVLKGLENSGVRFELKGKQLLVNP